VLRVEILLDTEARLKALNLAIVTVFALEEMDDFARGILLQDFGLGDDLWLIEVGTGALRGAERVLLRGETGLAEVRRGREP